MSRLPVEDARGISTTPMRTLDLFAGAGGLTQGFVEAQVPHDVVRAVESDPAAAATYRQNHGDVVYQGTVEDWLAQEDTPSVDLVVGGPPCQGFSQLGRQEESDLRNGLWQHYANVIAAARPTYFVMENVPRFLTSPQMELMRAATGKGGALQDYALEHDVLNAADFGSAQLRRRAVVIGHLRDVTPPGVPGATTPRHQRKTLKDALSGLPERVNRRDLPDRNVMADGKTLPGDFLTTELHLTRHYEPRSLERFALIPADGNRFDLPYRLQAPCWRNHTTGSGDVMGRLAWDKPSVTIRTEFFKPEKGRYLHPTEDRALTHHEAARIQGFPEDYRWVGTKTAIAKQIGNAVPIPLAVALASHISRAVAEHARLTKQSLNNGDEA